MSQCLFLRIEHTGTLHCTSHRVRVPNHWVDKTEWVFQPGVYRIDPRSFTGNCSTTAGEVVGDTRIGRKVQPKFSTLGVEQGVFLIHDISAVIKRF